MVVGGVVRDVLIRRGHARLLNRVGSALGRVAVDEFHRQGNHEVADLPLQGRVLRPAVEVRVERALVGVFQGANLGLEDAADRRERVRVVAGRLAFLSGFAASAATCSSAAAAAAPPSVLALSPALSMAPVGREAPGGEREAVLFAAKDESW